jgi:maltose O-acetyltransferase
MATDHVAGGPRAHRERMLAGDVYVADDPEDARLAQRAVRLQEEYRARAAEDQAAAVAVLAELRGTPGEGAFIKPPLFVDSSEDLHVGARTFVDDSLTALDVAEIRIGADCQLGPNVQLLTPTHPVAPTPRRDKLEAARPITIGDNVWLGGGAIVCPGVTIGDNTVVGAGSVAVHDLPANVVAAGSPARVVREISDDDA